MMDPRSASQVTFDTTLGRCAVRWSDAGITAVLLPHSAGRIGPSFEAGVDVPPFVRDAIEGMQATMAGRSAALGGIPLDEGGLDALRRAVYGATRSVPAGSTRTYGEIARAIGRAEAAREVGAALARNPYPILVPCHRIVAADGALTGFSAPGGLATKRRMLQLEGAPGYGQTTLFD